MQIKKTLETLSTKISGILASEGVKKNNSDRIEIIENTSLTEPQETNIPVIFSKPEEQITEVEYKEHIHSEDINAESLGRWILQHKDISLDNINSKLTRANTITEGKYRHKLEHSNKDETETNLAPFTLFRGVSLTSQDVQKMIDKKSTLNFAGCSHGDTYLSCTNKVANGYSIDHSGTKDSVVFVVPQDYLPVNTYRAQTDLHAFKLKPEDNHILENKPISRVWKQAVPIYSINKTYTSSKDYYTISVYDFRNILFVELSPLTDDKAIKKLLKKSLVIDESLALKQNNLDKLKKEHSNIIRYASYDVDIQRVDDVIKQYLNK